MFKLNNLILGAGDGMSSLVSTGEAVLTWAQRLGIISAAIAFCIGGYYLIWGGSVEDTRVKAGLLVQL